MQIFKTIIGSPEEFRYWKGNRKVNPERVKNLMQSLQVYGCFRDVVVVVIDGLKIILDGQHLYEALKGMGKEIPYKEIVIEKSEIPFFIARFNNDQKRWVNYNYLKNFMDLPDYAFLQSVSEKYSAVPLDTLILVYSSNGTSRDFKAGKFSAVRSEINETIVKTLNTLKMYRLSNARRFDMSITGLLRKGYDPESVIGTIDWMETEGIHLPERKNEMISFIESKLKKYIRLNAGNGGLFDKLTPDAL